MRRYRFMGIALLLLFLADFSACRKTLPNPITPRPDPVGYTQYGIPFQAVPNAEQVVMYEVNLRALGPNPNLQGVIQNLRTSKVWAPMFCGSCPFTLSDNSVESIHPIVYVTINQWAQSTVPWQTCARSPTRPTLWVWR